MAAPDLETITITDFRSIGGTLAVPLTAPVVVIHGTNGAGKSTVLSALELALTGDVASVEPSERKHLVHRGASRGEIELKAGARVARFELEGEKIVGAPLIAKPEASFFTERCYLAQRTLGRLLELYQDSNAGAESPLTQFVQELLRLDELDALLEGLHVVGHKRRVERLVPAYTDAQHELKAVTERQRALRAELGINAQELDSSRSELRALLTKLDAPPALSEDLDAAKTWLDRNENEAVQVQLVGARREIASMLQRASELEARSSASELRVLEEKAKSAREAVDAWRRTHGVRLEAVLDSLRKDIPSLPAAGTGDPDASRTAAFAELRVEIDRLTTAISADDLAITEAARLDSAVAAAQARVTGLDEQLAASGTATAAEELGKVLATLIPHVHTDDCPVCGRDFKEVSSQPLASHLATHVSELAEQADRLQALAKARLDALADLRRLQTERSSIGARRLEPAAKLAAQSVLARLDKSQQELLQMADDIADGGPLVRASTEAERDLALAREQDRAVTGLRMSAKQLAANLGRAFEDQGPLGDSLRTLATHVEGLIATLEERSAARRTALRAVQKTADAIAARQKLNKSVSETDARAEQIERGIGELDRRRDVLRGVAKRVEQARDSIVRQVFTGSLNRVWRDLFVRLAPEEPFVPVFRIPDPGERVVARLETVHRDGKPGGSPATMLSAGNLNTAALTLFLALNLSVDKRLPWIVLDDPVQSMDEVHVSQFAALLRTLSRQLGRRIVIAVHERALFDYLSLELSPARPEESLITVELTRSPAGSTLLKPSFKQYVEDRAFELA